MAQMDSEMIIQLPMKIPCLVSPNWEMVSLKSIIFQLGKVVNTSSNLLAIKTVDLYEPQTERQTTLLFGGFRNSGTLHMCSKLQ